ncbi:DNA adenine methylase [Caulobacter sp. S45]|uniref:DNA adenine methylase n=1 Tax=Caulobacter sp. S45 TaxID=1641861 RepID=UPI001575E14A|nr:DNA adenine methylase [Caulobacter sp. S45]
MSELAPTRPVLRYLGSKWRLAPKIIPWLPPHEIYVEPFGGAAAVLASKPRVRQEVWNDLDGEVVNLFQVLRSGSAAALMRAVELTPYARAEHKLAYERVDDPIERARRLLVRSHMGHGTNGTQIELRNGFRIDGYAGRTNVGDEWGAFAGQLELWISRMRGVLLEQRPATELIDRYDSPGVLLYVDPPYLPETRSTSVRWMTGKCAYAHEMTIGEHEQLLDQLNASSAMVVLSSYPSPAYDAALRHWRRLELAARAHRNSPRTELLWINQAAAAAHGLFAA